VSSCSADGNSRETMCEEHEEEMSENKTIPLFWIKKTNIVDVIIVM
jgi:hypothetical protein